MVAIPARAIKSGLIDSEEGGGNAFDSPLLSSSSSVLASAGIRSRLSSTSPATKAAPDPKRDLINTIRRLQAVDPEAAKELADKYGPDLNPKVQGDDSVLGRLKRTGGSLVSTSLQALNTPLNVIRGTIKEGPGSIPSAIEGKDFGNVLAPEKGGGIPGFAARFAEDVLLDPTTYATLGTGAAAKSALKGVGEVGGKELAATLAKSGVRKAIAEGAVDNAGRALTREGLADMLLKSAADNGAKDAEKAAAKSLTALDRGARGGFKLAGRTVVPGSFFGSAQPLTEMHPVSDAVGNALTRGLSGVSKAFVPRQAVIDNAGREAADLLGHAQSATKAQSANAVDEFAARLTPLTKEVEHAEIHGPVRQALEGTADAGALSPQGKKLYDAIDAERGALLQRQLDAGTILPDQVLSPATYVPIQMTEALRKVAAKKPAVLASIVGSEGEAAKILAQGGSLQHRAFENIDQAEKVWTERLGPAPKGTTWVEHNPAVAFALRDASAERAIAFGGQTGHSLVDRLVKDMPELVKDVAPPPAKAAPIGADITKLQSKAQTVKGRIKYVEGKLAQGGPSRVFGETPVGITGRATDALKADPVAQLGLIQHRMSLEGKLADLEGQAKTLREGHEAATAAREAALPTTEAGQVAIKVNEAGRHIIVPDWMAPEISKAEAVITNDETLKGVKAAADAMNHYWKSVVTVLPVRGTAFQSRNAQGNLALMMSRGYKGQGIGTAFHASRAASKGEEAIAAIADDYTKQMSREMRDNGIISSGFIRTDVIRKSPDLAGKNAPKEGTILGRAAKHHLKGEGKLVQKGHALNSAIEDASRASFYVDQRMRGIDATTASIETKKALFDYSDLTPFEKHAIGPFVSFYTFMRKNLGAQLWTLTHNPGKLTGQAHLYGALAGSGVNTDGPLPQYAVDQGGVPLGGTLGKLLGGGGNPVMGSLDLPMFAGIETAAPLIRAPKLAASFIPGLSGLRKPGDIEEVGREALNVPSGPILDTVRALTEATTHKSLLSGNTIRPGQEDTKLEEALIPLLGVTRRSLAKAGLAHTGLGRAIGTNQDKPERAQLASLLLGINTIPVDEGAMSAENYRRLREAQDIIARLKADGQEVPTLADLKKSVSGIKSRRKG